MAVIHVAFQPRAQSLRLGIDSVIEKREPNETIVVHYVTDFSTHAQYEVERRSTILGITFDRVII